jgi:mycothiol synthase
MKTNETKLQRLSGKWLSQFLDYCRRHENDHDESFLSKDELAIFDADDNPTLLLVKSEYVVGAISVMPKRDARIRIFHVEEPRLEYYQTLHQGMVEILKNKLSRRSYNLFIPADCDQIIKILSILKFRIERYVFVLERNAAPVNPAAFPEGYGLKPMAFPDDVPHWTRIRNSVMSALKGFVHYPEEAFAGMNRESDFLPEATLILRYEDKPVGIIKAARDEQESGVFGFIGPIALIPEYRGRGLGRNMLREIIHIIQQKKGWRSSLCVNANNEDALTLYLSEGFEKTETMLAMEFSAE